MERPTETKLEPKLCGTCGVSFGCGAKLEGCWCADVKITQESAADLKAEFSDCLCPKCLDKYASIDKTEDFA